MKKLFVVLGLVAAMAAVVSCKEKRCECITTRAGFADARSLEPLGSHKNCSELNAEWVSADSLSDVLKKDCVPYNE